MKPTIAFIIGTAPGFYLAIFVRELSHIPLSRAQSLMYIVCIAVFVCSLAAALILSIKRNGDSQFALYALGFIALNALIAFAGCSLQTLSKL